MNKFFKTLTTLVLASTVATPALAQSNHQHHVLLSEAVKATGVTFKINPSDCYTKENAGTFGWYWAYRNEMVICQENATTTKQVTWTEEDYDTLRHEAQHLIQDCMDGKLNDKLSSVYKEPIALAKDVIGEMGIMEVLKAYEDSSPNTKVMELEAFSVAAMNDPLDQARDIQKFCF